MAIGHWEDKFSLTNTGLPAVGAVYTVKNTGTSTLSTLTNAAGTPTGSSTFITDSRGNGGFYASDTLGYDIYDGGGTLILTDIRVVDIGGGGGALSYSSAIPADTTTGTAAAGTNTTGAPHADHTHHIGAHATTHNSGDSDAVTIAESQVTGLVTDLGNRIQTGATAGGDLAGTLPNPTVAQATNAFTTKKALVQTRVAQTLVASGVVTIDASLGNTQVVVLGATAAFNATSSSITNPTAGQKLTLRWLQGTTGGATYTWPTNWQWPTGSAPAAITTANQWQSATATYDGTNWNVEDLGGTSAGPAGPAGNAAPTGAAGGSLAGTYPNPTIASSAIADAQVTAAAAIQESKLNLASDGIATVPTRRTLGTGAQQALGGQGPGAALALKKYNPATLATYNITNTTLAVVDNTNLILSVTVPPSGHFLVSLECPIEPANAATTSIAWALFEGGAQVNDAAGTACLKSVRAMNIVAVDCGHAEFVVDSLTAGTTHTLQWAALSGSATNFMKMAAGNQFSIGAAIMRAKAIA